MIGYRIFGIPFASSLSFPGGWHDSVSADDATVVVVDDLPPWSNAGSDGWSGISDGRRFEALPSPSGEFRFVHGGEALFQLTADRRTLVCAPVADRDLRWWRILLDSVLFTVSLLRGNDALHAGAVATSSGVVAIVTGSGGGKSTLVRQLLLGGAELVTDDILFVEPAGREILAHPGPPLMTLPSDRAIGTVLGELGKEVWVTIPVASTPIPLRRIVLLNRRSGAATRMQRIEYPLVPLMRHLLNYPRTRERELTRFALASSITSNVEICRVVADVTTSPEQLASMTLDGLATAP